MKWGFCNKEALAHHAALSAAFDIINQTHWAPDQNEMLRVRYSTGLSWSEAQRMVRKAAERAVKDTTR